MSAVAVLDQGVAQPGPAPRSSARHDAQHTRHDAARRDRRTNEPAVPEQHPGRHLDTSASRAESEDAESLVELYESIASLLASRGQWRQAYEHLRYALEAATADKTLPPQVPQQFRVEVARLRREHAEAREQSMRDALTDSYNRRYLDQRLLEAVEQHGGDHAGGLAVAIVDLDWFKSVNDTFGHHVGDRVLQQVVALLQIGLPDGGFCARYGGEEFVLMLPGVDGTTATVVAEAARARIEQYAWATTVLGLRVTVSIGVAHQPDTDGAPTSPEEQLRSADALLYTAKQSGRNAVAYRVGGEVRLSGAPVRRPR
ncbi:MAG TPA: GGDEF domain-containing protein [Actinophytocola sp.]|nr:GGDEF domain-containing protein [Actinophytocola sp.]